MTFFFGSPSVSRTLRKAEANHLVKMWYSFPPFVLSVVCSSSTALALFICDVLMLVVCAAVSPPPFFFQEEVPPPSNGKTLEEEMTAVASQGVEEEAPSGGITEGVGQPMQGVQIFLDPETLNFLCSKIPNSSRLLVPYKLCYPRWGQVQKPWGVHFYPNKRVSFVLL